MTLDFKSGFAEKLTQFTNQKIALGFEYASPMRYLLRFDAMCRERYPTEHQLTREICMAWATKSQTEKNNSFRNRISPVREFARFLGRIGEQAHLIPMDMVKKSPPAAPYISHRAKSRRFGKNMTRFLGFHTYLLATPCCPLL